MAFPDFITPIMKQALKSNVLKSFTEMDNGGYYEQNLLRAIEEEMSDINVGTIARRIALGETLKAMDREMDKEKIVVFSSYSICGIKCGTKATMLNFYKKLRKSYVTIAA